MRPFLSGAMTAILIAGSASAQPVPAPIPAPSAIPPAWVARATAELQILDKVNARASVQAVPVGGSIRVGPLTVAVQACAVRPPDQAPDAAAFLQVTEGQAAQPFFRGWMFAANPMVAIVEHPIFDIRVVNCRS